ncbi:MAG: hypothetical protein MI921_01110 [Cytophagales bacterium]|nr:hypothetical protein [Cytophagales bacterium]
MTCRLPRLPDAHSGDHKARSFVSIPGNMRQQYHFASKNWARFYPLLREMKKPVNLQNWLWIIILPLTA